MDSRQIFGYSVTGADLSFTSSHPTVPSIPNRLFGSLKFDLGNSPNSPFSNLFDCDTLTTFSDSQEQHSSTENLSELSASCSSVETNSYFNHLSPSVGCRRDSLQGYSSGTSLLQNASPCHNIKHALLELESALMAPDADEVTTPSPSLGEDRGPQIQVPTPRAWSQEAQGSLVLQPQPSFSSIGKRLAAISEKFKIPVEFHPVPVFAPDITQEMLDVRPGEALAVNFPLQLHHTPDESVDVNNPRDELLRMVKSLSPKVTTLVEQESNTNTTPFFTRFIETLDYYSAMFESIDVALPRERKERINVEQHCLARDIVNIIACEGKERVERHELFGKWKSRLTMAGFRQYPLSTYVNSVIRTLLRCYSEHYTLVERDGAMLLGWKDRNLVSASAWY
ncbi:unnamed protein product, partial [Vitis vinifera]